jgi:putative redox protein
MQAQLKWTGGMKFEATTDGHLVQMDAKSPIGAGSAMTPKDLVAVALGGCTAMDVIALLKKHKQDYKSLDVLVDIAISNSGQPVVFTSAALTFRATGTIDKAIFLDAVRLSQTKYCGVSAMLVKSFPIKYVVELNGDQIGEGNTDFGGLNE